MCTTSDAECLRAEVGRESANERSVQVPEAEDPAAACARAALQEVDTPAAFVTVGRDLGVAEDAEFCHGPPGVPPVLIPPVYVGGKPRPHYTRPRAGVRHREDWARLDWT